MKHKLLATFLLMALLISSLAYSSDFKKGFDAFQKEDFQQAYQIFRSLANQGDALAQFTLGFMYETGQGVPQNDVEAVRWYRSAAEQGVAKAQNNLGSRYILGQGVQKNDAEAVRWFRAAAEQGDVEAQARLGSMYFVGRGVVQNHVQAHKWANISASQGNQSAVILRDLLAKGMTPAQIQEAQKLAQEWVNSR